MMNRIVLTSLVGTVAAAALVVGACAPAFASTTPSPGPKKVHTLVSVQAAAKTATDKQEKALTAAIAKLNAAKGVNTSDTATLSGRLSTGLAGLQSIEAKIAADTTLASASADFKTIFTTYRVFSVTIPQAHIIAEIDRVTSIEIPKLTASETKLTAALTGKKAPKSTAALQADLADLKTQITAANTELDGLSAKVLTVTPANFTSNKTVLPSARASLKTAHTDLKKARTDRTTIITALK